MCFMSMGPVMLEDAISTGGGGGARAISVLNKQLLGRRQFGVPTIQGAERGA